MAVRTPERRARRRIKALFLGFVALIPFQLAFSVLITEPWPSATFPPYATWGATIPDLPRHEALVDVVAYDSTGRGYDVSIPQLVGEYPVQQFYLLKTLFSPYPWDDFRPTGQLKYRAREEFYRAFGTLYSFTNYYENRARPSDDTAATQAWLREQLRDQYPGVEFDRVECVWAFFTGWSNGASGPPEGAELRSYVLDLR